MNTLQVALIQQSWDSTRAIGTEAGVLFHYHLLRSRSGLRPLLHGSIETSAQRWLTTVSTVVANLRHLDRLLPLLWDQARQQVEHEIDSHHTRAARDALLLTLEYCLGDEFSCDVEEAWLDAWDELEEIVFGAARQHRAALRHPASVAA